MVRNLQDIRDAAAIYSGQCSTQDLFDLCDEVERLRADGERRARAEFERGWTGGFKLGHRLGSEGKPANYPANLPE